MTTGLLFPLWQIDRQEYHAACAHLGITPKAHLYDPLSAHLAKAPFRFPRPKGFSLFLAQPRLTRYRIARLDLVTKLFFPGHPIRHVLNGVIAVHECDGEGYREMARPPMGWPPLSMLGWGLGFVLRFLVAAPWLGWQLLVYTGGMPFRSKEELAAQRILVTGVNRGLGMDVMLHCLERGAEVIGTVRNRQSVEDLRARLPSEAPVTLLIADLSGPNALVKALEDANIPAESLDMVVLSAGVKHEGESTSSMHHLRDTFQVNFFSAAEFAAWLCGYATRSLQAPADRETRLRPAEGSKVRPMERQSDRRPRAKCALVLVSSMGRWHGMHFASGYNASKAALSIWGESLDMELRHSGDRQFTVTIVEPGIFESGMTRDTPLTKLLVVSRRDVARRIVSAALAGKQTIRPPTWFALLTWGVCLAGRSFRYRLFARAKPTEDP